MKRHFFDMNLSFRLSLLITSLMIPIICVMMVIQSVYTIRSTESYTRRILQDNAEQIALQVKTEFDTVLSELRGFNRVFEGLLLHTGMDAVHSLAKFALYEFAAHKRDEITGAGMILEATPETPSFTLYLGRRNGNLISMSLPNHQNEAYYRLPKLSGQETILEPEDTNLNGRTLLVSSILVPLQNQHGDFIGISGVDLVLDKLQPLLKEIDNRLAGQQVYVLSAAGQIIAANSSRLVGMSINMLRQNSQMNEARRNGQTGFFVHQQPNGRQLLTYLHPITLGQGHQHWSIVIEIPQAHIYSEWQHNILWTMLAGLVTTLFVLLFSLPITRKISRPLVQINARLKYLAQGNLIWNQALNYQRCDEIGEIVKSVQQLQDNIESTIEQARAIARGDYAHPVVLHSGQDQLGLALREMTEFLRSAATRSQNEDWLKTGLSRLGKELSGDQTITELAEHTLRFLCPYLDAQTGLFYHYQAQELALITSYAFPHRKHGKNRFALGEGTVGQAGLERKLILLTHVPPEYYRVRSGTGSSLPNQIVSVPFMYNNHLKGVLELGTLHEFNPLHLSLITEIMPVLGVSIHSAESRVEMRKERSAVGWIEAHHDT